MAILITVSLLDIVTTLMVKVKQPFFNESNPIYIATGSITLMILWKLIIVFIIILFFLKWYAKPPIYVRYVAVVYLVYIIIGQFAGALSNIAAYKQEPAEVVEVPVETKKVYYEEKYIYTPKVPIVFSWFYMFIIFFAWWMIEKEHFNYVLKKEHAWNEEEVLERL